MSRPGNRLAREAAQATGALAATLAALERASDRAVCAGFAFGAPDLRPPTDAGLKQAAPGYRPEVWTLPLATSEDCRAAFTRGEVLVWPFGRIAAGQTHSPALDVFREVAGFRYTVHTPVRIGRRLVGALDFEFPRRPSAATVHRATAIAAMSGRLLGQSRRIRSLQGRVRALQGTEDQVRAEVAELLHGRVQGRLLVAADRIEQAHAALRKDPDGAGALLQAVAADLDQLRETEVRLLSHRLHPAMLRAGLLPALALLAEQFSPSVRVALTVDAQPDVDLPPEVRLAAYRLAEAALANVVRHAGADACAIRLSATRGRLVLEVRDEGRGFDPAATPLGLGLLAARDRAEALGGRLHVASAPGAGTTVTLRLPLS